MQVAVYIFSSHDEHRGFDGFDSSEVLMFRIGDAS